MKIVIILWKILENKKNPPVGVKIWLTFFGIVVLLVWFLCVFNLSAQFPFSPLVLRCWGLLDFWGENFGVF